MKQAHIKSLSLTTDPKCWVSGDRTVALELAKFHQLRAISWRGVSSVRDFSILRGLLQANANHLEELGLGLVEWSLGTARLSAWDVLQNSSDKKRITFPSLEALSLTGVSFNVAVSEMASAFNISGLCSLKLNKCPATRDLLKAITESGRPIRLTSLELVLGRDEDGDLGLLDLLLVFLQSFKGLEDLHLLIHGRLPIIEGFWGSVIHHQSTLKQLVYYESPIDFNSPFDKASLL
jgi:hypothetical protein